MFNKSWSLQILKLWNCLSLSLKKLKETIHIEEIDENFLGAVYKLRAVKANDGLWLSVIRCGFTGKELWCGFCKYASDDGALTSARHQLKTEIYKAIELF